MKTPGGQERYMTNQGLETIGRNVTNHHQFLTEAQQTCCEITATCDLHPPDSAP